jgi:peptide/nickel transport system permease protein
MNRARILRGATVALAIAVLILAPGGALTGIPMAEPFSPPSGRFLLGTDDFGRSMSIAVAQGARTSLLVGLSATITSLTLGLAIGLAAGLGPRGLDEALMRFADIVASLPVLIMAILVSALFGGSVSALALMLGLSRWPLVARIVRLETLSLRTREFVRAAVALGVHPFRIAIRHVAPQASSAALAGAGVLFGGAVLSEASLAFVGLGDPGATSLGQLAANGFAFAFHAPWMWSAPVAAIVAMTMTVAVVSDPEL